MPDYYLLSVIAFFALLAVLIYRDRKKIQISYYLLYMRRTARFRNFIDSIAKASPRFWKVFGTVGVIGPTRMAYERVIPIVDITAKLLSSLLTQR